MQSVKVDPESWSVNCDVWLQQFSFWSYSSGLFSSTYSMNLGVCLNLVARLDSFWLITFTFFDGEQEYFFKCWIAASYTKQTVNTKTHTVKVHWMIPLDFHIFVHMWEYNVGLVMLKYASCFYFQKQFYFQLKRYIHMKIPLVPLLVSFSLAAHSGGKNINCCILLFICFGSGNLQINTN